MLCHLLTDTGDRIEHTYIVKRGRSWLGRDRGVGCRRLTNLECINWETNEFQKMVSNFVGENSKGSVCGNRLHILKQAKFQISD